MVMKKMVTRTRQKSQTRSLAGLADDQDEDTNQGRQGWHRRSPRNTGASHTMQSCMYYAWFDHPQERTRQADDNTRSQSTQAGGKRESDGLRDRSGPSYHQIAAPEHDNQSIPQSAITAASASAPNQLTRTDWACKRAAGSFRDLHTPAHFHERISRHSLSNASMGYYYLVDGSMR